MDANILLYAEDKTSAWHAKARNWLDARLSESSPVRLSWPVLSAFLRLSTNRRVFARPLSLEESIQRIESWLDQPCVQLVHPTSRHWTIFRQLLIESKATGNLVSDAHLATLAMENGCELASTDADFARFPRLKWSNPLKD